MDQIRFNRPANQRRQSFLATRLIAIQVRMVKFAYACLFVLVCLPSVDAQTTLLELDFYDKDKAEPISCRVEITKSPKRFPKQIKTLTEEQTTQIALDSGKDILFERSAKLKTLAGSYEFIASRGIEFGDVTGGFEMQPGAQNHFDIVVPQLTNMNREGWFSGDLANDLPVAELKRWATADAVNIVATFRKPSDVLVTDEATNDASAPMLAHVLNSRQFRVSGSDCSINVHPKSEAAVWPAGSESESEMKNWGPIVAALPAEDWAIELADIWKRDLPIVLANVPIQAIQLLSTHCQPEHAASIDAAFFNPDEIRFDGSKGLGRLAEFIYWQMLEAGFHLPPTAGSGFVADGRTRVGYNRVYAKLDPEQLVTPKAWWDAVQNGFVIVTNGPLLRASINGQPPGGIVAGYAQQSIGPEFYVDLSVRDEVDYLDVIFNGQSIYQARLEDHLRRGQFPPLPIRESGWLVLRVVTAHRASYRMATTGPTYYEFDGQPRISRAAVQFFQTWLQKAKQEIASDPKLQVQYQDWIANAERFWARKALQANTP